MHHVGGSRPPECMVAQEEVLEEPVKETQIQPEEELKKINLGLNWDPRNLFSLVAS